MSNEIQPSGSGDERPRVPDEESLSPDALRQAEAALWVPPDTTKNKEPSALEALRAVPLFAGLRDPELKKILRICHERTFRPGEVIFREGDPGAGMYIIQSGTVRVIIRSPDGSERLIAQLTERQFFGEMALLEDAPRSATCVAGDVTELLGFFEPDLENLLDRDAKLGSRVLWNLARLMAARLRAMNEHLRGQRRPESR